MSQSKQKPPAFLLYARDFTSGTAHFSPAEVGAYMRCLCYQWECGGVPADDIVRLARIVGDSVDATRVLWDVICTKFRKLTDGFYWNPRLESVRARLEPEDQQKRHAGKRRAATAKRVSGGRFAPSTEQSSAAPLVAAGESAGTSAGVSAGEPLVKNTPDLLGNSSDIQRPASDPFPSPFPSPDVHANSTSTAEVRASSVVGGVPNLEQRPDGRDQADDKPPKPNLVHLARQPADDGNYAVALKLAHTVLDEDPRLTDLGQLSDAVKWRCAQARIGYDSDLVARAVASASARRRLDQVAVVSSRGRRRA